MNKLKLAKDLNTSPEVLEKLATDRSYSVRYSVARHPNCPIAALEKLATDEDYWVRSNVKQNPNCPEYIKTYLIARDFIDEVL